MYASVLGNHPKMSLALLEIDEVDVNIPAEYGWNPITLAMLWGIRDVFDRLLLRDDLDRNYLTPEGFNYHHFAAYASSKYYARELVEHTSADVNTENNFGQTPVIVSIQQESMEMFEFYASRKVKLSPRLILSHF